MTSYINNGEKIVFPNLFDAEGNVLIVESGETFDAPADLNIDGISLAAQTQPVAPVVAPTETPSTDSKESN